MHHAVLMQVADGLDLHQADLTKQKCKDALMTYDSGEVPPECAGLDGGGPNMVVHISELAVLEDKANLGLG